MIEKNVCPKCKKQTFIRSVFGNICKDERCFYTENFKILTKKSLGKSAAKNKRLLNSFIDYCNKHQEQRFWQALRNWSKAEFIFYVKGGSIGSKNRYKDTYYWEDKNK